MRLSHILENFNEIFRMKVNDIFRHLKATGWFKYRKNYITSYGLYDLENTRSLDPTWQLTFSELPWKPINQAEVKLFYFNSKSADLEIDDQQKVYFSNSYKSINFEEFSKS